MVAATAPTARNMTARGKCEAKRSTSPLGYKSIKDMRPEGPKYSALSGLDGGRDAVTRGDVLRFASHLPLAFISRAVGALFRAID